MATSFRIDDQLEALLQYAVKRTGQRRSELIREALRKYCTELLQDSSSPYERLMSSGFKPIEDADLSALASDPLERRKRLRERAGRDNR